MTSQKRLRVLLSAYACEPGKGSEPEVGWRWSLELAKYQDVTVLTRRNNRTAIENGLALLDPQVPRPNFIYHDADEFILRLKSRFRITRFYYIWWQRSAKHLVRALTQKEHFDLLHHLTFAGYRYLAAIWGHGVPSIWGPVGGMESIHWRFLPYLHPRELGSELLRNLNNLIQSAPVAAFAERAKLSSLVLASTGETQKSLSHFGLSSTLLPTIGLAPEEFPAPPPKPFRPAEKPLRLLFVGQIIWLKGVDLAVEALARSRTDATLDFIGSGRFEPNLRGLIAKLGLESRVTFQPRMPRPEVLRRFREYDVFLFPSLHDSGAFAVLEAMASELPVICLDCGGPALSVKDGCGMRIPIRSRAETINALAEAIDIYSLDPDKAREHGRNARAHVLSEYAWEKKGLQMSEIYFSLLKQLYPSKY